MTLAIITEAIRRDNHAPLRFFKKIRVVHLYGRAPYQDMTKDELAGAVHYHSLRDLYARLIKLEPDIIQGSEPFASRQSLLLSLVALLAARRLRVPLIFPTLENRPLEDRVPFGAVGTLLLPLLRWYFRVYAEYAQHIIALNNGAASNLRAAGVPDAKILRFPWGVWGVDRSLFYRRRLVPHPVFHDPTILFVGRLAPEKGVMDLLSAFAQLAPRYDDWQLVFIGPGWLKDDIQTFAKANRLADRIHVLGPLPNRELPAYYSAARVTVYPSVTTHRGDLADLQGWSEQVGTVILQSMACGTPVVATSSGAIPEYLHADTGLLVPEHDPEALARAIKRVMTDDRLRDRLSRNGERYIADRFDAKKNVEKAEAMILEWLHG